MIDLSISEQRARAGVDSKGRTIRRGKPKSPDEAIGPDGSRHRIVADQGTGCDERPDEAWEDANADERRAAFEEARKQRHHSRKAARRQMSLHARLSDVTTALGAFHATNARAIQAERGGNGHERVLPSGGDGMAVAHVHAEEVARHFRLIEKAVERLEEALDAHRGLAPARDYALMDSHEKNAVILTDFVGWRPEEVAAFEPAFGTARTIRYVREDWAADHRNHWPGGGVRGVCGHREGECTDACPPLRGTEAQKRAA